MLSETRPHISIQDLDKPGLERMLAKRLEDATPTVLHNDNDHSSKDKINSTVQSVHRRPTQLRHLAQTLRVVTDRCLLRLAETPLSTAATFPVATVATGVAEIPLRKESIMCRRASSYQCNQELESDDAALYTSTIPPLPLSNPPLTQSIPIEQHLEAPLQKTSDRRSYVLHEMLATEETYVTDLEILVAVFAVPLCEYAGAQDLHMEIILHPLQVLFSFQHNFLRSLKATTHALSVARLFLSEARGFDAYIAYCSKYYWLCTTLDHIENDSAWSAFLKDVQAQIALHSKHRRLGLRDFLIKPVQRICKYPLFIKDLIKHTDQRLEPDTYTQLNLALELIRGVCQGIDREQHRNDSLRLRHAILSRYCDNSQLPLALVAKLGVIILSGPLRVTGHGAKGPEPQRTFGCVLYKRFLIIFKLRKSATLVPQFWFPLHTMQLVDEGVEHAWQLQHAKSGQQMVFDAQSAQEKRLWVERLDEVIASSVARVGARRQVKKDGDLDNLGSPLSPCCNTTYSGVACAQPGPIAFTSGPQNNTPTPTFATLPFPSTTTFTTAKTDLIPKHFEVLTSPEILRLQALAGLKQTTSLSPKHSQKRGHMLLPAPPLPQMLQPTSSQPLASAQPAVIFSLTKRLSNSRQPSNSAAVEPDWFSETGSDCGEEVLSAVSTARSTCHESTAWSRRSHHSQQQLLWSSNSGRSNRDEALVATTGSIGQNTVPAGASRTQPSTSTATTATTATAGATTTLPLSSNSLAGRLMGFIDSLSISRRKSVSATKISPAMIPSKIDSCCSCSSFDASTRVDGSGSGSDNGKHTHARTFCRHSPEQAPARPRITKSTSDAAGQLLLVPFYAEKCPLPDMPTMAPKADI